MIDFRSTGPELDVPPEYFDERAWAANHAARYLESCVARGDFGNHREMQYCVDQVAGWGMLDGDFAAKNAHLLETFSPLVGEAVIDQ